MTSEENLRLQVRALTLVLKGFDNIYGLDDDHFDLMKYCSDPDSFEAFEAKIGILFCASEGVECLAKNEFLIQEILSEITVSDVRFSCLSGKLMTARFRVSSKMPAIVLSTYLEDSLPALGKSLCVEDISLGKIECFKESSR